MWLPITLCLLLPSHLLVAAAVPLNQNADHRMDTDQANTAEGQGRDKRETFMRLARPSSFVRIGKDVGDADGGFDTLDDMDAYPTEYPASKMARIRRFQPMHRFVRIGRRNPDTYLDEQSHGGYSSFDDDEELAKRVSSFVRIGKSLGLNLQDLQDRDNLDNLLKRASQFVRIGRGPSSFVRIGKSVSSPDADSVNDPSDMVLYGNPYEKESMKRASNFVRIGKGGKSNDGTIDDEKRASSFVRIGKSQGNKYLKAGKGLDNLEHPRFASFSQSSAELPEDDKPINLASRSSAFVRIGKIPHSAFVRIGKNNGEGSSERRSSGRNSNFVRIG